MENPILLKLQKKLKSYFTYFKHDEILVVSEDKTDLPFAYVIADPGYPGFVLVSFSVDYGFPTKVANFTLKVNNNTPTMISEPFFISQTGNTLWGEEAERTFELENLVSLNDIEPESKDIH